MNIIPLTLFFTFVTFSQTLDLRFHKHSQRSSFIQWREIEFLKNEQIKLVSLTVPIVIYNEKFFDAWVIFIINLITIIK